VIVAKLQAKRAARKAAPPARGGAQHKGVGRRGRIPYYNQTTDFTCGPSSLLMAMKTLDPKSDFSRAHELQLWREAGQPLANHTYDHMSLNGNPLAAFEANVAKDEMTLQELMGKNDWHWFRYPYLDEGDTLIKP